MSSATEGKHLRTAGVRVRLVVANLVLLAAVAFLAATADLEARTTIIPAGLAAILLAVWLAYRSLVPSGEHESPASLRSDARAAAAIESALDAVITIDHTGAILEFNPAAERTFGRSRADVLGLEMAELLIPAASRDAHRQGLRRLVESGVGTILDTLVEVTALRADGKEFPIELAITRVSLDGPPVFTGYIRDISDRTAHDVLQRITVCIGPAYQVVDERRDCSSDHWKSSIEMRSESRTPAARWAASNTDDQSGRGLPGRRREYRVQDLTRGGRGARERAGRGRGRGRRAGSSPARTRKRQPDRRGSSSRPGR